MKLLLPWWRRLFNKVEAMNNPDVGTFIFLISRNPLRRKNASVFYSPTFNDEIAHKIETLETVQAIADAGSAYEAMAKLRAAQPKLDTYLI